VLQGVPFKPASFWMSSLVLIPLLSRGDSLWVGRPWLHLVVMAKLGGGVCATKGHVRCGFACIEGSGPLGCQPTHSGGAYTKHTACFPWELSVWSTVLGTGCQYWHWRPGGVSMWFVCPLLMSGPVSAQLQLLVGVSLIARKSLQTLKSTDDTWELPLKNKCKDHSDP